MSDPLVSIITPSYNRAKIVVETAESIFRQSYENWEWVVVDDGSTDGSWDLLNQFQAKDNRVKIFKRDREPKGAATCRNIAVEKCKGEYLIFLDTDDLLAHFCLEQRLEAMRQNPYSDFIIFPMLLFSKQPDDKKLLWNVETGEGDLARVLHSDPICQGTGTLWKKESFVRIGMWREDLKIWQDIELHIRSFVNNLKYIKRLDLVPDVFLRVSEISLSRTGFHSFAKLKSRIAVFEYALPEIIKRGPVQSELEGLKSMGFSLILNALNGRYLSEASQLMKLCRKNSLLSHGQYFFINLYLKLKVFKVDKLPIVNKYFTRLIGRFIPPYNHTLGKVRYAGVVSI
ncbi:MAG: glycosyltransferase [Chitinophagaceae bacterium]|nr:glycosyltransferase [Chitinophagaceae bacterium]